MHKHEEGQGWLAENKRWLYPAILFILGNATGGTAFNLDRIWDYMPSDPTVQVRLEKVDGQIDNLESVYAEMISRVEDLEKTMAQNKKEIDDANLPQDVIDNLSLRISKLEEWHKK